MQLTLRSYCPSMYPLLSRSSVGLVVPAGSDDLVASTLLPVTHPTGNYGGWGGRSADDFVTGQAH